ncbi:hypothetical protein Q4543_21860 [Salipiger sp. 1_MG-2023]|uniref:hypothetical protein n=1 Tax=Salipiger sp. 1_MG-2023 TaxID=3062665 RepID=UPI0026E3E023|nr:hypothetical protein [Salipiger sp. 1_MG-2023]MDO6588154.1 hypothetical protein [Salipiger sp. 1_MG-2023]
MLLPNMALAQGVTFTPGHILANMEKSAWLSTRRGAKRAAYVIAAPWCPFCKQLYETILATPQDIDYRFVFMGFRQYGPAVVNAFFSDADDQVGLFYNDTGARNPALSPRASDLFGHINLVTGHLMAPDFGSMTLGENVGSATPVGFAYPSVVLRDGGNDSIVSIMGAWMYLDQIGEFCATQAATAPDPARYGDYLRAAPQVSRSAQNFFAREADTPYFAAPVPDAPFVDQIRANSAYPSVGTVAFGGEDWVAVRAFTSTDALQFARRSGFYTQ